MVARNRNGPHFSLRTLADLNRDGHLPFGRRSERTQRGSDLDAGKSIVLVQRLDRLQVLLKHFRTESAARRGTSGRSDFHVPPEFVGLKILVSGDADFL